MAFLELLNGSVLMAPMTKGSNLPYRRLCVEGPTLEPRFTPGAETAFCALVTAVLDALELARDWPGRVRECAAPACPVIYLDTSRNRSRRWCSMEDCGNRAKARRHYASKRKEMGD